MAATPLCASKMRGVSLVEVLIYSAILSVVVLGVYQIKGLLTRSLYQSINSSQAEIDNNNAITKLRKEVQLSDVPIRIMDQTQTNGAPSGTATANCIEMQKFVLGAHTTYSISLRWDDSKKAFKLVHYKTNGCSNTQSASNGTDLSDAFYLKSDANSFFTPRSAQENQGYREINFNFKTQSGKGSIASGLNNTSVELSANSLTPHECRVASPDRSWFSEFSGKKVRTVTVSFTQNFDSGNDRLNLQNTPSGVVVKTIDDLGILHLHAKDGLSVADWISLLSNVTYKTVSASSVTESTPPKRISFVLGDGLSFSPAGQTSAHFYMAVKLNSTATFATADTAASSFCYPAFNDDTNYLAKSAKPTSPANSSCSSTGNIKRLTGHLATITTEGEHEFVKNKVLKLVYPESAPYVSGGYSGAFSTTEADRTPTTGQSWLGGEFSSSFYRWNKGYESSIGNQSQFADTSLSPQAGFGSAGKFFVSLFGTLSGTTPTGQKTYYTIAGNSASPNKYWSVKDGATDSDISHLIIEFGDNRNADGNTNSTTESDLNSQIRLKKDISIVPFEFFKTCSP
jgi:hypothetical protein